MSCEKTKHVDQKKEESTSAEELVACMGHADRVLCAIQSLQLPLDSMKNEDANSYRQDCFARLVQSQWNNERGPSKRYLQSLTKRFVKSIETEDTSIESDELMKLMFLIVSTFNSDSCIPDSNESCYLAFQTRVANVQRLRIRIFPQHNDVALRLWEAGATLAEYLLHDPCLVKGKRVVELGAGVGLTGLVAAGCCGASSVCLTDYTDASLDNLRHNVSINHEWLHEQRQGEGVAQENENISVGYLDWSTYGDESSNRQHHEARLPPLDDRRLLSSYKTLSEADVLIAADVAYDWSVIGYLARIVRIFLTIDSSSGGPNSKRALFTTILRNQKTFNLLETELANAGIRSRVLATGHACEQLPLTFPTKFVQPRSDIRICSLELFHIT
jgi:predicted nicotinamide N-methyase